MSCVLWRKRSAAKDWELADSLRSKIAALGFVVKDVLGGDPIVSRDDSLLLSNSGQVLINK